MSRTVRRVASAHPITARRHLVVNEQNDVTPPTLFTRAKALLRRYFVDGMGGMGLGLFASLLIGLILSQIFKLLGIDALEPLAEAIRTQTGPASPVVGAIIGVSVARGLKAAPLPSYAAGVAGAIAYAVTVDGVAAGPAAAFIAALVASEVGTAIAGRTPIDIVLVPGGAIVSGATAGLLVGAPIAKFMLGLGAIINTATGLQPFWMGIAVASLVGAALTAPISSAALAIMMGLDGLAAGAATAGCAAHMVGFAVASYKDNGFQGLLAQGLGTSMLQLGNIARKPLILLPAVVAALVGGALSATVFGMENVAAGAGMGTSGLVGPLTAWPLMSEKVGPGLALLYMTLLFAVIPSAVALGTAWLMRRRGLLKDGDMDLHLEQKRVSAPESAASK